MLPLLGIKLTPPLELLFIFFVTSQSHSGGLKHHTTMAAWLNIDKLPGKKNCATFLPKAVDVGSI